MGRKVGGFGGGMGGMMRQMQKIQKQMEETQEMIEQTEVEGTAGSGAVIIRMNGKKEVISLNIDPEVIDKDDKEMLEDLLTVAFNDALSQVNKLTDSEMGKITGGINIPGLGM